MVILAVRPEVDCGRYPVKRVLGDTLELEVDLVVDGHDLVRAAILDRAPGRAPGEEAWRETALVAVGNDTWRAAITLPALGRHLYAAIAWVDAFATWRHGLAKKLEVGAGVEVELLDGAALVRAAFVRGGHPALREAAEVLAGDAPLAQRIALATSARLADAVALAPDRVRATRSRDLEVRVERPRAACSAWYELFPRSTSRAVPGEAAPPHGTLRDAEQRLDYIAELGFDIVYLPPIHPIGRAFRKGPDNHPDAGPNDPGSPWAIGAIEGGHTSVHPQLGTLDDFDHFVAQAVGRGLEVALDIAFQASPDHPWVTEHPSWFLHRADGSIQYAENPPKKYQDVYPFDFASADWQALWAALRDVFLFWAARGVRAFRVDNPHTKPLAFWEWCLREVHDRYPDAIFLAEAFTRPKLMGALGKAGFSQSYTYFTWRQTKYELETYAAQLREAADYLRPNLWPTTPDIFPEQLVHGGRPAFVQRVVLAATLSASYGIYGPSYELCEHEPRPGAEELARNEKYQVRTWDLARPDSLRHVIARLNHIRRAHPALQQSATLHFHPTDNDLVMAYSKRAGSDAILVIVNLDPHHAHRAWLTLDLDALGVAGEQVYQVHDLLGGARYTWHGARNFIELDPAQSPAHIFAIHTLVRSEQQFEYYL
ncbi:MAG: alpha-1,4-glucan--maltose-1-phosphate maltosyltransferase [Kofleriaceae bacterium]